MSKKKGEIPPRPRQPGNAFIIFIQEEKKKSPDQTLSRSVLSNKWETMPEEQKKVRLFADNQAKEQSLLICNRFDKSIFF